MNAPENDPGSPTGLALVLSTLAITSLAVAQPVLDLLGRNPEFFLAHASPALDVILVGVLLGLVFPLAVAMLVFSVYLLNAGTGRVVHAVVLAVMGGLLTVTVFRLSPAGSWSGWLVLVLAVVGGVMLAIAYERFPAVRSLLNLAAIAPLVVAGIFLFASPTSALVSTSNSLLVPLDVSVGNPAPVVMVVFDEFPIASIIDEGGDIQVQNYPNFARLARDGTWFRNAVGLHQNSELAIPTIVTGVMAPLDGKVPRAEDYPNSIFSLFGGAYEVRAVETITELCPEIVCEGGSRESASFASRWKGLIRDVTVVSGNLFIPQGLGDWLPPIDQTWGGFTAAPDLIPEDWDVKGRFRDQVDGDRRVAVERFLELIDRPLGPREMYFTHLALPHWPWIHLPDGRPFALPSSLPANDGPGWGPDPWLVEQAYQRHLFQVQYADAIVGQIIARLEKHGSYDDALIIVMADHGVTIRPGVLNRRAILPETVGDVAAVPLFVKQPGQQQGGVDDYRAESVDILPTIAALLEVDVPWSTDGVSLFGADRPRRVTSTMISKQGSVTFGTTGAEKLEVVEYHQAYFGGRGPFGIAPLGQADLLGLEVTKLAPSDLATVSVTLDKPDWYSALDIGSDTLFPALMSGTVSGDMEGDVVLAIALNGRVAAVTRTWEAGDKVRFQAMIPIEMLAAGPNAVDILAVEGSGIDRTLWRLGVRPIGQSPPHARVLA